MNPYIYLGGAILAEVIGTTLMKFSEGFTRLWPSVGTIICYCASFWLLAQTLAYIPTGIAYAIWSGVGIVLISLLSWGWICPYISRHLLSLNPLQARCRRYSRGER
ncbi:multidrug efflux SMR transporter EmrE [Escherichia coli]